MTRRGTTPTHVFKVPIDLRTVEVAYMTYKQKDHTVIEKTKDDMEIAEDSITIKLTQEDTLGLCDRAEVKIQFRGKYPDQTVVASKVKTVPVCEILKEGII